MQPCKLRSFQNSVAFLTLYLFYNCFQTVQSQRPLFNHTTFNSLPTQQNNNYYGGGHQLRNGRQPDMPLPQPTTTSGGRFQQGVPIYEDPDMEEATRYPPYSSRRDNRRRLNLSGLGGGQQPFPEKGNGRRGIDSLRKELMKPSVGGPGGGISGQSTGYPSYVATSSIGKIDGQGGLGPADRYGDHLIQTSQANGSGQYPARYPNSAGLDDKFRRISPKKTANAITELLKTNRNKLFPRDQPDSEMGYDLSKHEDPIHAIQEQVRKTSLMHAYSLPIESDHTDSEIEDKLGVKCVFDKPCAWNWTEGLSDGFQITSGLELARQNLTGLVPGPIADSVDDATGKFLYARLLPSTKQVNITSPQFSMTLEKCFLEVYMHQSDMSHGQLRVVIEPLSDSESSWVPAEMAGDNYRQWAQKTFRLGRISRSFRIVLEIVPILSSGHKAHVAIDNLRMVNCFPEGTKSEKCSTSQLKCLMNTVPVCIPLSRICDITRDCDEAEDEYLNCDKIPYGGRCNFDEDWCGWRDSGKTILAWSRHNGASPTVDTGPEFDHTNSHLSNSSKGYYMLVNMNQHSNNTQKGPLIGFASNAILISKVFNPPPSVHGNPESPYRNSCVVRFYIHQFGKNAGSINFSVIEMKEKENITTTLWWSTKNQGSDWLRAQYVLPNITSRYYLQFEARMGLRIYSDVAVDDFSLSPECFGLNIPPEHLGGYNYYDVRTKLKSPAHRDFEQKHYLELTTCDTRGMIGPTQLQCEDFYKKQNKTHILKEVRVIDDQNSFKGMQKWKVPHEGFYTIIAKGASGGLGSGGIGSSRGAVSVAVVELHKNEELFILVGQQGENACIKSMGINKEEGCGQSQNLDLSKYSFEAKQHMVKNIDIEKGAGGGGGGSYVFLLMSGKKDAVPLIVAGGGGGLGIGRYIDEDIQHGRKANYTCLGVSGQIHGINNKTGGPGGGWRAKADQALGPKYGAALLQGGRGGHSCFTDNMSNGTNLKRHGQGGFGGGGGGCYTGGGGGGYTGGDVYANGSNGEGGTSYIETSRSLKEFSVVYAGASRGAGVVMIIPAIEGCGCDYRCVALDEFRSSVRCICPEGWRLKRDNSTACEVYEEAFNTDLYYILFLSLVVTLIASLICLCNMLYSRHKQKREKAMRQKMLEEQDMQLSRLRHNIDATNLNNFNPNYGCDGILNGHVDVNSLPQVARESLRLIKPLGQGAFGEVYQGLYRHRDGDAVEMPVAVKTLPEMSTRQAEEDFLMEAFIMSKFNHANMVHLIGVCFDRHPRFIVLELLAGGDLKNFLREGRHKPERPSTLTMKDLVFCALDVAKGCRYMESKRFIHRDIAARNCLLSSKGPGRVVKIADFGMARDIYRSDYYRKGGKAMLPIKWMPPEAFLDGIFTSKTDVWSFGVLLWEVFSLGLMPYTGLPNPEVMQLVTNGGRLGCPTGCPAIVYKMMVDCWNPNPEDRPTFSMLLERITGLTQDPEVMNAPLPSILRQPTSERDQTIMRPPGGGDEFCIPVPNTSDYLIPLPNIRNGGEYASSAGGINRATSAVATTSTSCSPPAINSPSAPNAMNCHEDEQQGSWETSFILPNSKSDQPLLEAHGPESLHSTSNTPGGSQCGSAQRSPIITNKVSSATNTVPINGTKMMNGSASNIRHEMGPTEPPEAKLISLDTPQPTPTTIQPPLSFSNQLEGITLDPAALAKSLQQNGGGNAATQSYANIQMMSSVPPVVVAGNICSDSIPEKQMNGTVPSLQHNGTNSGLTNGNASAFTIQGYAERYKDNHSEISC